MERTSPTELEVFQTPVQWEETEDVDFPWKAALATHEWKLRINDFPEEPLFTLFIDGSEWGDFDDWPPAWKR